MILQLIIIKFSYDSFVDKHRQPVGKAALNHHKFQVLRLSSIMVWFISELNGGSLRTTIKFTMEIEENNQLPFLDVLMCRQEDKITTLQSPMLKVYRFT